MTDEQRQKRIEVLESSAGIMLQLVEGLQIARDYLKMGDEGEARNVLERWHGAAQQIIAAVDAVTNGVTSGVPPDYDRKTALNRPRQNAILRKWGLPELPNYRLPSSAPDKEQE